ncbi:MAG: hypothetical protein FWB97_02440 [Oscillospiraceae bacterium]|nr:hypothetical protein [Oscillospiraceae bacterium]
MKKAIRGIALSILLAVVVAAAPAPAAQGYGLDFISQPCLVSPLDVYPRKGING